MIRISTGSRLHFGLFRLPPADPWPVDDGPAAVRYYGGAGLMIERPGVRAAVVPANDWSADGPLADRALACARRCAAALPTAARQPRHIIVEACPPDHVGLGTGTQLGLAVARALARSWGIDDANVPTLARLAGRGRRSAIGVHGFALGGFLVDGGKRCPDELAPLTGRADVPTDWRIVLLIPTRTSSPWHGAREEAALEAAGARSDDTLERLAQSALLPALVNRDFRSFGAALFDFNTRAGEHFRTVQGSIYATPETAALVGWLRNRGVTGAGQSSWGPTAFGIVRDEEEAQAIAAAASRDWGDTVTAIVTQARNQAAA